MGVGASTPKKTSDYSPVDQGDGGTRPLAEQTGLGDGVKELPRYGTFFEIPDHLEIPKMRLRDDGVFVSGLPDELDPQRRERYERALFRLFFQRALYERGGDGRPPTFMVSEGTLIRDIAKRTIGFADHVMRYVESTCGIEPKRFLDAAVKYTESWVDADQPRSVLGLVECCLSFDDSATTEDQKQLLAGSYIEGPRAEVAKARAGFPGGRSVGSALASCQFSVPDFTDGISTMDLLDPHNIHRLHNLHFGIAFCCLKNYQAVLSHSKDVEHLVLAAKAASTMHDVGHHLDPTDRELNKPMVEPLLDNLEKIAASDDFQEICKCAEALEFLLPVDGRALDVLAAIKTRCADSGELNRLIEALDASASRPANAMKFLRF